MVDQQRPVHSGCSAQASSGNAHPLYRCQCLGLGCSSGTGGAIGQTTSPNSISMSSKCNDGYFHGSGKSTSCNPQHHCHDCDRQCVSGIVYHKTRGGGDSFPNLVSGGLEPPIVVSSKGNNSESQTYPWQIQHPGRPSLKNVETCSDRMVSQSDNSQSGLLNDWVSQHRSVCDSSQQQTSNVCVTYSRQQSSGNRLTVNQLGSYPRICVSPVSPHSQLGIICTMLRNTFWWHFLLMLGIHARNVLWDIKNCARVDATSESLNQGHSEVKGQIGAFWSWK